MSKVSHILHGENLRSYHGALQSQQRQQLQILGIVSLGPTVDCLNAEWLFLPYGHPAVDAQRVGKTAPALPEADRPAVVDEGR